MTKSLSWNLNPFSQLETHSKPSTDSILEESWSNTLLVQRILIGTPIFFEEANKNEHTLAVIDYCGMVILSLTSYYIIANLCDESNQLLWWIPLLIPFLVASVYISCSAFILDTVLRLAMTILVIAAFPMIAAVTWGLKRLSKDNIEIDTQKGEESTEKDTTVSSSASIAHSDTISII